MYIYKKTSMQIVAFHAFHMCVSIQDTIHMGHIIDLLPNDLKKNNIRIFKQVKLFIS